MNIDAFRVQMNKWGHEKVPFLFVVDFEMENPQIWKSEQIDDQQLLFYLNGVSNSGDSHLPVAVHLEKFPKSISEYKRQFDYVMDHLAQGDSFLTNLTLKTEIKVNQSLKELFYQSKAKYKLWIKNQFLLFSPEVFVQIRDGKIFSFPMKGTIDANVANAREIILSDHKELSEHVTIVDLIRNDLSQIASNVQVVRFRYIDEIKTTSKDLLQVSSEIRGDLRSDYTSYLGDLLLALLPAGSVSGAPKVKTVEIIKHAENEKRGYYTGVFGYFDGVNLDSGVMIRFIEQQGDRFFYRSGGGITTQSTMESEYQEAIDKIYVPVD